MELRRPPGRRLHHLRSLRPPTNVSIPGDLYLSYREGESWTEPISLSMLNTEASDLAARLSPDGKTLYFSSNRSGGDNVEIYRVQLEEILTAVAVPGPAESQ